MADSQWLRANAAKLNIANADVLEEFADDYEQLQAENEYLEKRILLIRTNRNELFDENKRLKEQPCEKREHIGWWYPERQEFSKADYRHENAVPVYAIEEQKGNELTSPDCQEKKGGEQ